MHMICLLQKIPLLEIYLLLNHVSEVCSDNVKFLSVDSKDIQPDAFTYRPLDKSEACDKSEGQGLHVQTVQIRRAKDGQCERNLNSSNPSNPSDNHFMQTVRRACSGRDRCYFVSGLRRVLRKVTCGSKSADSFELSYVCKPLAPDDNKVFDIKRGFIKTITNPGNGKKKYYLVLGANETIEHSRCEMSGPNVQIHVTLMHADLTSVQKLTGKSCLGNQEGNIDWYSVTHSLPEVCLSYGTFELSRVTGLVWIEMSGSQSFTVACNTSAGSGSGAKDGSSQIQVAVPVSVVIILVVLVVVVILVVICLRHRKRKGIENLHQHELLNKSVDGHEYVTMDKDSKQTSPTAETTTSQRPSGGSPGGRPTSANRMEASAPPFLSPETSDQYPRDERVQATYATVNKIRNSDAVSAAASSPGATNGTRSERGPADSTHEANEYSHLARHRKEGRMTENHYDG